MFILIYAPQHLQVVIILTSLVVIHHNAFHGGGYVMGTKNAEMVVTNQGTCATMLENVEDISQFRMGSSPHHPTQTNTREMQTVSTLSRNPMAPFWS